MRTITSSWRAFRVAVQFLTRIPMPGGRDLPTQDDLARSVLFFPFVGGLIGFLTALVILAGASVWPIGVAVGVALALEAVLTGGFHEDALADASDAFGGAYTAERTFEIMKDSRIGTFGALALIFGVGLRWGTTVALPEAALLAAVIAAAAIGRLTIVAAMVLVPPVGDRESTARDVGRRISIRGLALAALLAASWIAPLFIFDAFSTLVALCAACSLPGLLLFWSHRRLGGVTGDVLGAVGYSSQLCVLLAILGSTQ